MGGMEASSHLVVHLKLLVLFPDRVHALGEIVKRVLQLKDLRDQAFLIPRLSPSSSHWGWLFEGLSPCLIAFTALPR